MPRHLASSGLVLFALVLTLAAAPAQAQAEDPVASDRKTYEKIGRFDAGQLKREQDTIRVTHAQSPDDYVSLGRDVESQVLARAIHAHIHRRVFLNGNKTVVFPASPGSYASERMG